MQRKNVIQIVCAMLFLITGIYLNVYNMNANFKAFVLPEPLETLLFLALLVWIGVTIYTRKKWVRRTGVVSLVAIGWYHLGLKVPYEAINNMLNNANQVLITIISITFMIVAAGWLAILIIRRDEHVPAHNPSSGN